MIRLDYPVSGAMWCTDTSVTAVTGVTMTIITGFLYLIGSGVWRTALRITMSMMSERN